MYPNNGRRGADVCRTSDIYQATIRVNTTRDKLGMHQQSRRRSLGGWVGKAEAAAAIAAYATNPPLKKLWPKGRITLDTSEPPINTVLHKVGLDIYTHAAPARVPKCQRSSFSRVHLRPYYVMIEPYPIQAKRNKKQKQTLSTPEPTIHNRR